jgi:hypothetical protein
VCVVGERNPAEFEMLTRGATSFQFCAGGSQGTVGLGGLGSLRLSVGDANDVGSLGRLGASTLVGVRLWVTDPEVRGVRCEGGACCRVPGTMPP